MTPPPGSTTDQHYDALAAAIAARRQELGLTQQEVTAAGGPSHQTLRNIEHGSAGSYQPGTLRRLDQALRWPAGTSQSILANGSARSATSATRPTLTVNPPTGLEAGDPSQPSPMKLAVELLVNLGFESRTAATAALETALRAWLAEQLGVDEQAVRALLGQP